VCVVLCVFAMRGPEARFSTPYFAMEGGRSDFWLPGTYVIT
jgi:hypothetical protein